MKETYHTTPTNWRSCLSFNTYIPITCDDLLNLQTQRQLLKAHGFPIEKADVAANIKSPQQYFFGNHPVKWVRLGGRIESVNYRESMEMVEFSVTDGFGSSAVNCVLKTSCTDRSMKPQNIIIVYGEVSSFGGEIQIRAQRAAGFVSSQTLRYYALREEAMQVRKHFLERSADEFRHAIDPVVVPKTTITELVLPETAGLRRALNDKSRNWEFSPEEIGANPIYTYNY